MMELMFEISKELQGHTFLKGKYMKKKSSEQVRLPDGSSVVLLLLSLLVKTEGKVVGSSLMVGGDVGVVDNTGSESCKLVDLVNSGNVGEGFDRSLLVFPIEIIRKCISLPISSNSCRISD